MKKVILVAIGVLVMSFAAVGVASAGNPHNGTDALTDICAGCHRAHTAPGNRLTKAATNYDLCISCHNGTGSKVNVQDGKLQSAAGATGTNLGRLNGGGFVYVAGTAASTSSHTARGGADSGVSDQAWGAGSNPTGTSGTFSSPSASLNCSSCHDVHGTTMYRLLKYNVGSSTGISVAPGDTYLANTSYSYASFGDDSTTAPYKETIATSNNGISAFCAGCHTNYKATAQFSGSTSTSAVESYRRRVDMDWNGSYTTITVGSDSYNPAVNPKPDSAGTKVETIPLAWDTTQAGSTNYPQYVMCLTCHFAHGTSNPGGSYQGQSPMIPGTSLPAGDTSLVRSAGRGVCQTCHQRPQ